LAESRIDFETSIFLARQMYNALASTYNLLFRNRSPLDLDWNDDENFARIAGNTEIRDLLGLIKEQTQTMCKISYRLSRPLLIVLCLYQMIDLSTLAKMTTSSNV
jgi:hypothetical protein